MKDNHTYDKGGTYYQSKASIYRPISEGMPLADDVDQGGILERRALSVEDSDSKTDNERRHSPDTSFESSVPSSTGSSYAHRPMYDCNNYDDDEYSVASTYTYGTVDTTATSESVHSIISRLQSETDRRRRRLMRRRSARGVKVTQKKTVKQADPLSGITVEVRE